LDAALLCIIYGVIIENILFKDDNGTNIFRDFNPTQIFLYLKTKLLLIRDEMSTNVLIIILLCNDYFLKYFFNKYIEIIFLNFLTLIFLYHHIKTIHKHKKKY